MSSDIWLCLSSSERALLREALSSHGSEAATVLEKKVAEAGLHPDITVGVYGGQVQWTSGNPFPIRIVDYDGEREDLPATDENGDACRIWFEPSDQQREEQLRKKSA
jgi:hypothetical protein